MSNTMPPSHWEELRRQSRKLESEIDQKLVSFSKLGTNYGQRELSQEDVGSGHLVDTISLEVEQLLHELHKVNDAMNELVSSTSVGANGHPSTTLHHTMKRHNEILQDYSKEFGRTKNNIIAMRQREELLGTIKRSNHGDGVSRRTDLYLKEHEHLRNTDQLTDDAISIAIATRENLSTQRGVFVSATSTMSGVTNRFPLINTLVQKINLRKRRDSLILGGVISVCVIILLLLAFR
ncbi:Golgi SNAP receptor complex member 1-like [Dysidea avara]|uniref:Golgi SNAP receptor complex member 1-like n=1 Tax=Dysidea avara TaxID=196820 RepID=UPI003317C91A